MTWWYDIHKNETTQYTHSSSSICWTRIKQKKKITTQTKVSPSFTFIHFFFDSQNVVFLIRIRYLFANKKRSPLLCIFPKRHTEMLLYAAPTDSNIFVSFYKKKYVSFAVLIVVGVRRVWSSSFFDFANHFVLKTVFLFYVVSLCTEIGNVFKCCFFYHSIVKMPSKAEKRVSVVLL